MLAAALAAETSLPKTPQQSPELPAGSADARSRPAILRLDGVTKTFPGGVHALRNVSLEIRQGEYFSILGDSGCGKSTLLRLIAGLEKPEAGRVFITDRDITEVPAYRRPVNMMFQSYALFPHYSVFSNVAFGLRQERIARVEVTRRVGEMLALVELSDLARRKPHQLSGGQQQRVALARALVKQPKLLLLDEPMAALDRNLRERTQLELARIQQRVGVTFVMVTHDQQEAMHASNRIGVMRAGEMVQVGTPREIYESPANRYVASFIGATNLYAGRVANRSPNGLLLDVPALGCQVAVAATDIAASCWIAVRPEKVRVRNGACPEGSNLTRAKIEKVAYLGGNIALFMRAHGGGAIRATAPAPATGEAFAHAAGDEVCASWQACDSIVLAS